MRSQHNRDRCLFMQDCSLDTRLPPSGLRGLWWFHPMGMLSSIYHRVSSLTRWKKTKGVGTFPRFLLSQASYTTHPRFISFSFRKRWKNCYNRLGLRPYAFLSGWERARERETSLPASTDPGAERSGSLRLASIPLYLLRSRIPIWEFFPPCQGTRLATDPIHSTYSLRSHLLSFVIEVHELMIVGIFVLYNAFLFHSVFFNKESQSQGGFFLYLWVSGDFWH